MGQARDCCTLPRFKSTVPVIQQTVQVLADITAAVARTGARAHAGNLVLAWVTSFVLQARPVLRACTAHLFSSAIAIFSCACQASALSGRT